MKKVAIIILNWNGKKDTAQCLGSIGKLQITNYKLQIIVVDNGSTDGSVDYIKNQISKIKITNQKLKIIENKKNLGFAEGNNIGIKRALKDGADYVIILNNDTLVDKSLVFHLIEMAEGYPNTGILSPKIYFAKGFEFHKKKYEEKNLGKIIWYAGGKIDWDNVLASHRGVDEVDIGQYNRLTETDYATGACMLVKKEVFKKIGLLDPDYFLYWEDADFCQRAKRAGFKVLYVPGTYLWHKVAQSSAIGSNLNDYYITRNRLLFGSRYAPLRSRFALLRESVRLLFSGRSWQRRGVIDYFFGNLGKGSFSLS